jgi:anti-anti-sigma factor
MLNGELSIRNAEELHKLFVAEIGRCPKLIVDLSDVYACDTAALQLICSLRKTAVQRGQRFRIAALSPAVEAAAAALGLPIQELTGADQAGADAAPGGAGRGT